MKVLSVNLFFSCINGCIEDMVTFTVLEKINSMKCLCNTKVAGVGKFFSYENFQLCSISRVVCFFFYFSTRL